ncbi:MAG TPA: glycoside hydrolase family 38 C-terminal domain-containing protein [Acidimicrobiales bacterium]
MARRVDIVPHTHWDREWYSSFQTFRLRLVDLMDEFLPLLESDPAYRHFLLDGQMAVIDDYLEIRPEAEDTIRRLAASGRVALGPWYVLMDEFLVSGETIIRNLQLGIERAAAFAGASDVGYLPDMFGHVAQMPQILRQAGFEHTAVWRGVPSHVDRTAFWWEAPDGSVVRAEYMPVGYGNGAAIPDDGAALVERIAAHDSELSHLLPDGWPMLWMNGTDHEVPQPWLGRVVTEANSTQDDYDLVICSLSEHVHLAPAEELPEHRGELRSGARANLLMGVASNRVDVKQAAARAELSLERLAEPLCTLFLPAERWPQSLLDVAWKEMIRNSAHDTICACSIDEVCEAAIHRYGEARDIGVGLTNRALKALASSIDTPGWVVVNADARPRSGVVEMVIETEELPVGAQLVEEIGGFDLDVTVPGRDLGTYLGMLRSQHLTEGTYLNGIDISEHDEGVEIVLHIDSKMVDSFNVEEARRKLYALGGARPDTPFHATGTQPTAVRALARVTDVPAFGWTMWTPRPLDVEPVEVTQPVDRPVLMSNGFTTVCIDPDHGTFSLDETAGMVRLVDGGDLGDTYNYSPPVTDDLVAIPESEEVTVEASGPVVGRIRVLRTYHWPTHCDPAEGGRRVGTVTVGVDTVIELHAGERFVRVAVELDNHSRDHRLRAHFPLPQRADHSRAECAFAVVQRGLEAEGGPTERALPTFPSRRFVSAGGLTIAHEGLAEYEVVDEGRELALTLLRCTGMLSRPEMAYRPLPAGPDIAMEGPQMQGRHTLRFAVSADPHIDPYAMAADAFVFLSAKQTAGDGDRSPTGAALDIDPGAAQISSLRRHDGAVELRVFNPTGTATSVRLRGATGWLVDLRDRPIERFHEGIDLGPYAIATARLDA